MNSDIKLKAIIYGLVFGFSFHFKLIPSYCGLNSNKKRIIPTINKKNSLAFVKLSLKVKFAGSFFTFKIVKKWLSMVGAFLVNKRTMHRIKGSVRRINKSNMRRNDDGDGDHHRYTLIYCVINGPVLAEFQRTFNSSE